MSLHRRILTPAPTNGSDCSGVCSATAAASRHLSNLFIAAGCLSAAAFFLALTYYAVFNRRRRRRLAPSSPLDGFLEPAGDREHHLWHIRTVGLDEATINSIPECTVQNGVPGVADCSVCLAEFQNGELVRLLPKCAHAFHVKCIDTWLRAHVTCPLCRAPVIAVAVSESVEEEIGTSNPTLSGGGEDEVDVELSNRAEPVRRSVSMPVVEMEGRFWEEEKELGCVGGESSETKGKEGSSSKDAEKTLSGSGRGFFFTKNGRTKSLVLPL